ncbi:hypothetical protein HA402_014672 [Bradysia odoriphaga]|nr:hypothetical protein HA402_014672 [Bradysia odoriphaga]
MASVSLLLATIVLTTKCRQANSNTPAVRLPEFAGPIVNVSFPIGREAVLTCNVANLGGFKVGWLRASDQTVLALQERVVTHNERITITHEDFYTWRLRIKQLRETDRGCYMCQINTLQMIKQVGCIDVQVPPDILSDDSSTDVAVQEGDDALLTCRATGNPPPRVIWRREDGQPILMRRPGIREMQRVDSYNGTQIRLIKLERRQMGVYFCIASNDVPPAISKRVSLSVHFPPTVQTPSQLLGSPFGSDVELVCHVESSPAPVFYWLRGSRQRYDGTGSVNLELGHSRNEMLLDGPKYSILEDRNGYKGLMTLIIRSFSVSDVGTYHCVSTNSLGKAEGTIRVYGVLFQ